MSIVEEISGLIRSLRKASDLATAKKLVDELERQVAALQARLAELEPRGLHCEACGHWTLFLVARRREQGPFGELGAHEREYRCRHCGATDVKPEVPS